MFSPSGQVQERAIWNVQTPVCGTLFFVFGKVGSCSVLVVCRPILEI